MAMISPSTYFPEGSKQKIDRSMVKQQRVRREKHVMEMFISIRQFMLIMYRMPFAFHPRLFKFGLDQPWTTKVSFLGAFVDNSLD